MTDAVRRRPGSSLGAVLRGCFSISRLTLSKTTRQACRRNSACLSMTKNTNCYSLPPKKCRPATTTSCSWDTGSFSVAARRGPHNLAARQICRRATLTRPVWRPEWYRDVSHNKLGSCANPCTLTFVLVECMLPTLNGEGSFAYLSSLPMSSGFGCETTLKECSD